MINEIYENFRDLIELIPIIREKAKKGMELDAITHEHDIKRLKIERRNLKEVLSLFHGKWTIDIIYTIVLLKNPSYNEIKKAIPELNSRTLTSRLKFLEKRRIVIRDVISTQPVRVRYSMTEFGKGIYEMLLPLFFYFFIPKKFRGF
ncbi:MAG: winged helix-turn-helix transcriptional regulator [Promethearchaeota archaeon]